jgi:AcrR family transcriptional regulator
MSNTEHMVSNVQNRRLNIDRRVERTSIALQRAMIELVKEHGYDYVEVQHITERANIGRSTFYTHFKNKEDVLLRSLDGLHEAMRNAWLQQLRESGERLGQGMFVMPFITHFGEAVDLWRAFATGDGAEIVTRKLRVIFTELFREDLGIDQNSPLEEQAIIQLHVGALLALVVWWLDLGATISPEAVYKAYADTLGYAS